MPVTTSEQQLRVLFAEHEQRIIQAIEQALDHQRRQTQSLPERSPRFAPSLPQIRSSSTSKKKSTKTKLSEKDTRIPSMFRSRTSASIEVVNVSKTPERVVRPKSLAPLPPPQREPPSLDNYAEHGEHLSLPGAAPEPVPFKPNSPGRGSTTSLIAESLHLGEDDDAPSVAFGEKPRFSFTAKQAVFGAAAAATLSAKETALQRFEMDADMDSDTENFAWTCLPYTLLKAVVGHKVFEFLVMAVICCNVVTIGTQADWSVKSSSSDTMPRIYDHLDMFYAVAFTLEWLLRTAVEGRYYFAWHGKSFAKNMFDTLLVISSIGEEAVKLMFGKQQNSMSSMRVIRVFRLIRIARVIRLARSFHDLRVMVNGIMISMKSLLSASVLLLLMGFIFGVAVLEFVSMELHDMEENPDKYADVDERTARLRDEWGSVVLAVFTLYKAISGGVDWGDAAEPLMQISPLFGLLFCMYVAIAVFCVLNIITGVFVENTKSMLAKDESQMVMDMITKRREFVRQVRSIWTEINSNASGTLDLVCLREQVKDVKIQALFARLGLDIETENAEGLFQLLDIDGDGTLDVDEFANGLQMVAGNAKNIDMARLRYEMFGIKARMDYVIDSLLEQRKMMQKQEKEKAQQKSSEPGIHLTSNEAAELLRLQALLPGELDGIAALKGLLPGELDGIGELDEIYEPLEPDGDSAGGGGRRRPMLIEEA